MSFFYFPFFLTVSLLPFAHADNGMDMSMDGAMSMDAGNGMTSYLHFTPGDTLLFYGWVPRKVGAIVGACIGLFLLALVERWVAAMRAVAEGHWRMRAQIEHANRLNALPSSGASTSSSANRNNTELKQRAGKHPLSPPGMGALRTMPPFIPAHDITRGVMHAGQALLGFVFMLAVMTFNASFIISIVVGLGVGETLFGRYVSAAAAHH